MFDVITIGSATVDVFTSSNSSQLIKIKNNKDEDEYIAFRSGDKIVINDLDFKIGGGGTNTAVSFSRLGLKTAYLGKIGIDDNSEKVLNLLEKENIKFIGARDGKTGYSVILNSLDHDRTILTYKGSNNNLKLSDVTLSNLNSTWIYASSMIEESFNTLKQIMDVAKKTGSKIAFNPSLYQVKKGIEELYSVLKITDVLILNKEEAQTLLGKENEEDLMILCKEISKSGPKYIVITDGSNGVICYHENIFYILSTSPDVKVVESTGAGDAFGSAFITGLFYQFSVKDALRFGMVQAENVIQQIGAKEGLLNKLDSFRKLKEFKGKLKVIGEDVNEKEYFAQETKEFTLQNGDKIYSLNELPQKLLLMPEDVFNYHVAMENHFAKWIDHVFGLTQLANEIQELKSKEEIIKVISKFLKRV